MSDLKSIVRNAVKAGRDNYSRLQNDERLEIVSMLLADSEQALIDADHNLILQKAIAKVIACKGNTESMAVLYQVIEKLFLDGHIDEEGFNYESHFAEKIDDLLNAEWNRENSAPNEHFEHDCRQRARDIRETINSFESPY